jgi:hypothetical protein
MSPRLLVLLSAAACTLPTASPTPSPAPAPSPHAAGSGGASAFDLIEYAVPAGFTAQPVDQQIVMAHADDARGTYEIIVLFPSRAAEASPERDFAAEWQARVASNLTAPASPAPTAARTPGEVAYLEGGGAVVTGEGAPAYAHLWMLALGERVQTVMILTPSRQVYDDAGPALTGFLAQLRVRGAPGAAVAARRDDRSLLASDAPIVGIWIGFLHTSTIEYDMVSNRQRLELAQTKIRWRTFLADGSSFESVPDEGLLGLDVAAARKDPYSGGFWGTWTMDGNRVTAAQGDRRQDYDLSGDELRQDPETTGHGVFWRAKSVDGLRLDGQWSTSTKWDESYAASSWKTRPLITFRSDGTFVDEGAFVLSPLDEPGPTYETRPGRGTYEIAAFTLVLRYDDGHELRRACMPPIKGDAMRDSSVLYFGRFLFYRQ